jgi:uncharacterized protein (DUF1330 family)
MVFGMIDADPRSDLRLAADYDLDATALGSLPDRPFTLVNFFRIRDRAVDEAGADDGRTGLEAMLQYAEVSGPRLRAAGGRFLTRGLSAGTLWGADPTAWDLVVVAEYPDGDAFRRLLADGEYQAAFADRRAAVAEQRVVVSISVDG